VQVYWTRRLDTPSFHLDLTAAYYGYPTPETPRPPGKQAGCNDFQNVELAFGSHPGLPSRSSVLAGGTSRAFFGRRLRFKQDTSTLIGGHVQAACMTGVASFGNLNTTNINPTVGQSATSSGSAGPREFEG